MRSARLPFVVLSLCSFLLTQTYTAAAFHSGTTGDCNGCHTSHNSAGNQKASINDLSMGQGNAYMLSGQDPSSTCLGCHEQRGDASPSGYHVSTPKSELPDGVPPRQLTPGGDFGWLKKNYAWTAENGAVGASPGYMHGHNIIAADFGYQASPVNLTAPGGSYPSSALHCTSCHDPHGKYRILADGSESASGAEIVTSGSYGAMPTETEAVGVYRLLGGAGYETKLLPGFTFMNPAPAAVVPAAYNRGESSTQTRVAYGRGMSEWCGNCHERLLNDSLKAGGSETHPSGAQVTFGPDIARNYNSYVRSGEFSGSEATAFISLVPFETGDGNDMAGRKNLTAMAKTDNSNLTGPGPRSVVSCLTCHRAHASGWDGMLRWNSKSPMLVYKGRYPGIDGDAPAIFSQGRTQAETQRAYYEYPAERFAYNQRSLCNKCHVRD
ncbi:MAG: cytochrome C [Nitrospirota bacterium]